MAGGGKGGSTSGQISIVGDETKPVSFDLAGGITSTTDIGGTGTPIETRTEMGGTGTPLAASVSIAIPDPIQTDSQSKTEFAVTQPIETSSDMRLDVKPVVVDLCLTAGIGKIPRISITRPYDHHVSLRVLGMEIFGLDLHGQNRMVVDDLPPRPATVWGGVSATRDADGARAQHRPGPPGLGSSGEPSGRTPGHPAAAGNGLRIRLGD